MKIEIEFEVLSDACQYNEDDTCMVKMGHANLFPMDVNCTPETCPLLETEMLNAEETD